MSAIRIKEAELGRKLTPGEKARILARGRALSGGVGSSPKDPAAAALAAGAMIVAAPPRK